MHCVQDIQHNNIGMKEIGSIFPATNYPDTACQHEKVDSSFFYLTGETFSLCREALYVIAQKVCGKVAMVPSYTCDTVIQPLIQAGYSIIDYPINKNLTIDTVRAMHIYRKCHADIMVTHPYYGMDLADEENNMLEELHDKGCTIIVDLTQCLFSQHRKSFVDYYVGSTRKWFAIPDGAFAIGNKKLCNTPLTYNTPIIELQTAAMQLRDEYLHDGNAEKKTKSIKLSHEAEDLMNQTISPHAMSINSKAILANENIDKISKIRISNYRYLYEGLKDADCIELVTNDLNRLTTAPLYFPFYTKDMIHMQNILAKEHIYLRNIWTPKDNILTIAIDQRYDLDDMQRVIDCFTQKL